MGPTWVLSDPGGSHVGSMNLAIWGDICTVMSWFPVFKIKEPSSYWYSLDKPVGGNSLLHEMLQMDWQRSPYSMPGFRVQGWGGSDWQSSFSTHYWTDVWRVSGMSSLWQLAFGMPSATAPSYSVWTWWRGYSEMLSLNRLTPGAPFTNMV